VPDSSAVYRYHDATKHDFNRFARSLGYLDWASQPRPFRAYTGSPVFALWPRPEAAAPGGLARDLGDLLRFSLGLSAWKQYRDSRWSLRVNPSSGNLHPTEAYVACGDAFGLAASPAVYHYAADRHELELRCVGDRSRWLAAAAGADDLVLVILTSIHWREAWKYGERAFRYCQHDLGHAIAAVATAAGLNGWQTAMLPGWTHAAISTLAGLDRDDDFVDAEREEPGCVLALTRGPVPEMLQEADAAFLDAIRNGRWTGHASQLSEDHVQWTLIDEITDATRTRTVSRVSTPSSEHGRRRFLPGPPGLPDPPALRSLILRRRSAVAFDGVSATGRESFLRILSAVMPNDGPPWNAMPAAVRIHLALFVHRVDGVTPGLYLLARQVDAVDRLRAAMGRDFLWQDEDPALPLFCLARGDCRKLAARLSCDQDIAGDGFFSLGMLADFDEPIARDGPFVYRQLFWEAGVVGQVLYLQAEAAGARGTGIGCFYDDPVHDVLGLRGHAFQSLYHFTIGMPVDDPRLTTSPGYSWGWHSPGRR
jgi:SagB-type dehydrogenase family enzyme